MNRECLTKDVTILQLINHFETKFGKDSFQLKDYWKADLFAVGISDTSDTYLLYVSTWNKQVMHYYVSVELENLIENEPDKLVKEYENATLQDLDDIFISYFNLEKN